MPFPVITRTKPIEVFHADPHNEWFCLGMRPVEGHRSEATIIAGAEFQARWLISAFDGETIVHIHTSAMQSGITDVLMVLQSCDNYIKTFHRSYSKGDKSAYYDIETQLTQWIG